MSEAIESAKQTVLKRPIVTEKSTCAQRERWFCFFVSPQATKLDVKREVEEGFGEEVEKVSVVTVRRQKRRFKGVLGETKLRKKAFVKVKSPGKISEFFGGFSA